jgi:hypothetical protein
MSDSGQGMRRLYVAVLLTLAAEILLFTLLTRSFL